jgi:hypothetical protein
MKGEVGKYNHLQATLKEEMRKMKEADHGLTDKIVCNSLASHFDTMSCWLPFVSYTSLFFNVGSSETQLDGCKA